MGLISSIRNKYNLYQYKKWYEKWSPYYLEHPYELKELVIKIKWEIAKNPDEDNSFLKLFSDWSQGWLEENGYW